MQRPWEVTTPKGKGSNPGTVGLSPSAVSLLLRALTTLPPASQPGRELATALTLKAREGVEAWWEFSSCLLSKPPGAAANAIISLTGEWADVSPLLSPLFWRSPLFKVGQRGHFFTLPGVSTG